MTTANTSGLGLVALNARQKNVEPAASSHAHLDLLAATGQTARFAARVLGPLALRRGVLTHSSGGDYMHVGGACVHLGRVVGVRDIVVGGGCRAGETGGDERDGENRKEGDSLVETVGHLWVWMRRREGE